MLEYYILCVKNYYINDLNFCQKLILLPFIKIFLIKGNNINCVSIIVLTFSNAFSGVILHNQSFLFATVKDWLFATLIIVLGFVGNFAMLKFLTMEQDDDESRNGWTNSSRTIPVITVGVLARSALEIVVIYGINYSAFTDQPVVFEDGLGMAFLIGIGLFCCFIKPVEHIHQPKDSGANQ